jgi:hypothetical protein
LLRRIARAVKLLSITLLLLPGVSLDAQSFKPNLAIVDFASDAQTRVQAQDVAAMRSLSNKCMADIDKYNVLANDYVDEFMELNRIPVRDVYKEEYYTLFADAGIAFILSATISVLKDGYRINYFFINTKKKQIFQSDGTTMKNTGPDISNTIRKSVVAFFDTVPITATDFADAYESARYSVGDTGPAGGIIFFVKGNFSDGWRYLEAAPSDMNVPLPWGFLEDGGYWPDAPGTEPGLGNGKHNTELLDNAGAETKVGWTAAQVCITLEHNGFNDWYLPSRDELNLLFHVLAKNSIGAFSDAAYWTSTQSARGSAWYQTFNNGRLYPNGLITDALYVRPIRSF